jgi:hypothetical protein
MKNFEFKNLKDLKEEGRSKEDKSEWKIYHKYLDTNYLKHFGDLFDRSKVNDFVLILDIDSFKIIEKNSLERKKKESRERGENKKKLKPDTFDRQMFSVETFGLGNVEKALNVILKCDQSLKAQSYQISHNKLNRILRDPRKRNNPIFNQLYIKSTSSYLFLGENINEGFSIPYEYFESHLKDDHIHKKYPPLPHSALKLKKKEVSKIVNLEIYSYQKFLGLNFPLSSLSAHLSFYYSQLPPNTHSSRRTDLKKKVKNLLMTIIHKKILGIAIAEEKEVEELLEKVKKNEGELEELKEEYFRLKKESEEKLKGLEKKALMPYLILF